MQLGKLILSYLFLCVACVPTFGSTNKCRHSPNTDCYQENLLTGWFHDLSSSRVQCFMMNTCSNSSYFSSKEECEQKCALKCQEPTSNSPYEPNTVIISKDIQGHSGLTYSSYSTCGSGYILIGSSERTCNTNGNWSGEEPICYEIIVAITSGGDTYELDSSNILEVEKGQQLKITCTVKESVIDHDTAWRKVKGQRTHALPSLHDMRTGKDILNSLIYIQIDRASSAHSGIYSCLSQNNPILLSRNFTLRVKDPKKAPKMISSSIIIAKNTITLQCYGYGQPAPRVNWYKDGVDGVLVHGENITLSGANDAFIAITISNPNCTHIGKYICKAENEHGMLVDSEKTVTAEDVGLPDIGSGAYECRETHNESCFLCPYNKAPVVKTCNTSDIVISVRLSVNETSLNSSKMYTINESKVLKGSNSSNLQLNMLKLTEKAATCHCPTLNAETWFICTGTIHKDMFIVSEKDMICATSDRHQKNLEKHCRELDVMTS